MEGVEIDNPCHPGSHIERKKITVERPHYTRTVKTYKCTACLRILRKTVVVATENPPPVIHLNEPAVPVIEQ